MRRLDVLCLGTTAVDVMARPVDRMPDPGTQVLFDKLSIHPGGGALNQSIGLARLGVRVALAAKIGKDLFGDFLMDTLKSEGVDTSLMIRAPGEPTCFTFAPIGGDGTRRYFSCLGTNATARSGEFRKISAQYQVASTRRFRILSVGGASVMPRLDGKPLAGILRQARSRGTLTTVDTAFNSKLRDWKPLIRPLLPHTDYFFPSIEEARLITGEKTAERAALKLAGWGGRSIGVKLGPDGVYFAPSLPHSLTPSPALRVPAFRVKPKDASGAGDAFMAGFILGLLEGRTVRECLVRGQAVAAHCIQAVGCTAGLPDRKTLDKFLRRHSPHPNPLP